MDGWAQDDRLAGPAENLGDQGLGDLVDAAGRVEDQVGGFPHRSLAPGVELASQAQMVVQVLAQLVEQPVAEVVALLGQPPEQPACQEDVGGYLEMSGQIDETRHLGT